MSQRECDNTLPVKQSKPFTMRALSAACAVAVASAASPVMQLNNGRYIAEDGRVAIMHGLNAVYKLNPWIPNSAPGPSTNVSLNPGDMAWLHQNGFNVLRMSVMWDGAYLPQTGSFNQSYMRDFQALVDTLYEGYGIWTLLDMHQDDLTRKFCGEGVPTDFMNVPLNASWLAFPFPIPANLTFDPSTGYPSIASCLTWPFFSYMFSAEVNGAVDQLYHNTTVVQAFAAYWAAVAQTFSANGGSPGLVGYELMNEPWPTDIYSNPLQALIPGEADQQNLFPLYESLSAAIRQEDSQRLIMFEPAVTETFLMQQTGFTQGPGSNPNATVFAFHNYCENQDAQGDITNVTSCQNTLNGYWALERANRAKLPGSGAFLTEFGAVGAAESSAESLSFILDLADQDLVPWAYWSYKYYDDITTQNDVSETLFNPDGSVQQLKLAALSRTYAPLIAALPRAPISLHFNSSSKAFSLSYTANPALANQTTTIFFNEAVHYPAGIQTSVVPAGAASVKQTETNYLQLVHSPGYSGAIFFTLTSAA